MRIAEVEEAQAPGHRWAGGQRRNLFGEGKLLKIRAGEGMLPLMRRSVYSVGGRDPRGGGGCQPIDSILHRSAVGQPD